MDENVLFRTLDRLKVNKLLVDKSSVKIHLTNLKH